MRQIVAVKSHHEVTQSHTKKDNRTLMTQIGLIFTDVIKVFRSVQISLISPISVLLLFLTGCNADFSITGPSMLDPAPVLSVCGDKFCLDGMPTFLTGISYYGGLTAPASHIAEDLDDLKNHGFNWIRVWNTWTWTFDTAAVLPDGSIDEHYMTRLKYIIEEAGKRGMIVDVTLEKEGYYPWPQTVEELITVARVLAQELKPYRNVYFDIANERNLTGRVSLNGEHHG